jgi:hypothetical protein
MQLNVAVTDLAALISTTQVPVPEQPLPVHPLKTELEFGVAVNVTLVPALKFAEQVGPQSIPAGAELTLPPPVPFTVTVKIYVF